MPKVLLGDRIGKSAVIRFGCSAAIFAPGEKKLLLTRRRDNGLWCLPGGAMEPGESAAEACAREVWEEIGLHVRVQRLIGVYSNPNQIIEYSDGRRCQIVALNFEVEIVDGELGISSEVCESAYFTQVEMERLEVMSHHRQRILDAFARPVEPFIR